MHYMQITLMIFLLSSCSSQLTTPKEFFYLNPGNDDIRHKDSLAISDLIRSMIDNRDEAFYGEGFNKNTTFLIPKILYSPDGSRFAFFVVTQQVPSRSNMDSADDYPEYPFYGTVFLGKKKNRSKIEQIRWFQMVNVNSEYGYEQTTKGVQEWAFNSLSGMKDSSGEQQFWNLNDIRFWENDVWGQYF